MSRSWKQGRLTASDANHSQPCVSNPDVVRITADFAIARFDEHPELSTASIGMNDTNRFCECRECLAVAPAEIREKRARIAYAFFDFYNKVADRGAEKYPDTFVIELEDSQDTDG